MKRILLLTLFFFTPSFAAAAAEDPLPRLLEEETLLVLYADFSKIDAQQLVRNNQPIIETVFAQTGFYSPEMLKEFFPDETERKTFENAIRDWDKISGIIAGGKGFLTETLGIEQAYFVQNIRGFEPGYFAVPKTSKLNVKRITSMIESGKSRRFQVRETDDFLFIGFVFDRYSDAAFPPGPKRVVSRPEFLDARKEVEQYPIQLLWSIPRFVEKAVADTRPELPPPFEKLDLTKLVGGIRFEALGFDPMKPEAYGVAHADSELAAQESYHAARSLLDLAAEEWKKQRLSFKPSDDASPVEKEIFKRLEIFMTPENWNRFRDTLLPEPQGASFMVRWDSETIRRAAENVTPIIAKMIEAPIFTNRKANRRTQCANNMKKLGHAVQTYNDTNGSFPPAYTVDKNGKPLHSWRVLLLPYVESHSLYEKIRKDEPWDSEYNKQFHDKMPGVYRCSECTIGDAASGCNYCMVVGEETFGKPPQPDEKKLRLFNITDGTANTIMLVERKEPVCWMEPTDIPQEVAYKGINKTERGIGSFHQGGVHCVYVDGSVHFISETIDLKTLKALLTPAGGESVQEYHEKSAGEK